MNLTESRVFFDPIEHTYTLEGKQLKGITGMIKNHLFADKYSNVPTSILENARKRGDNIHNAVQNYDVVGVCEMKEVEAYRELKAKEQITTIANEYVVSDNKHFASPIDIVAEVKGKLSLIDIKCTYTLDVSYLRWQLSIYKYLFEMQNPTLKAEKLYGLHFKNEACTLTEIEPIEQEHIQALLQAEIESKEFINPFAIQTTLEQDLKAYELVKAIAERQKYINEIKEEEKQFKIQLEKLMNELGADKLDNEFFTITKKKNYTKTTFDNKTFKADNPELAKKYEKQSEVKGGITIKLKEIA